MFYPYITWGGGLQIAYSEVKRDGTVLVRFELPDERLGFKFLECELPTYRVVTNKGFSTNEVAQLIDFCRHHAHLMMTGARNGGEF